MSSGCRNPGLGGALGRAAHQEIPQAPSLGLRAPRQRRGALSHAGQRLVRRQERRSHPEGQAQVSGTQGRSQLLQKLKAGAPPSHRPAASPARISVPAAQTRVPPGPSGPPGWARIWTWGAAPGEGAPVPPPLPPAPLDSGDLPPMGRSDGPAGKRPPPEVPFSPAAFGERS